MGKEAFAAGRGGERGHGGGIRVQPLPVRDPSRHGTRRAGEGNFRKGSEHGRDQFERPRKLSPGRPRADAAFCGGKRLGFPLPDR